MSIETDSVDLLPVTDSCDGGSDRFARNGIQTIIVTDVVP
jgi:hypothetical protein